MQYRNDTFAIPANVSELPNGEFAVQFDDDEDIRYRVAQDPDAVNPVDDMAPYAGVAVYRTSWRGNSDDVEGMNVSSNLPSVFAEVYDRHGDDDLALRVAQKWGRIHEPLARIATYSARGYSQSDWWDLVAVVIDEEYGTPDGYAETWERWARGDVMMVCREKRVTWTNADGEQMFTWEEDDAAMWCGGFYADSPEDAAAQYAWQN